MPGARASRRSAAVNDRRPPRGGERVFEHVIDGENGVVPCEGTASPPLSFFSSCAVCREKEPTEIELSLDVFERRRACTRCAGGGDRRAGDAAAPVVDPRGNST